LRIELIVHGCRLDGPFVRTTIEPLETRLALGADLTINVLNTLPAFVVPGDRMNLAAVVQNVGDEVAKGPAVIRFWAPSFPGEEPLGAVATVVRNVNLRPGQSITIKARAFVSDIPEPGVYNVAATVEAAPEVDEFVDNNLSVSEGTFRLRLVIGSTEGRRNVTIQTFDEDGSRVTFALRGPGFAEFITDPSTDVPTLMLIGTTEKSTLSIAVRGGTDRMTDISLNVIGEGSLRAIDGRMVNFSGGRIELGGTLGAINALTLADTDVLIHGSGVPTRIAVRGDIVNLRYDSQSPIHTLQAYAVLWLEDNSRPELGVDELSRIEAPWMGRLNVREDFSAIVGLWDQNTRFTLNNARIGGVFSGEFVVRGDVSQFSAAWITNGMLLASGTVRTFTTGMAIEASLWAGHVQRVSVNVVTNLEIAAGASLTEQGYRYVLQGEGSAVSWGAGTVGTVNVRGNVQRIRIAAGVDPINGSLLDQDDLWAGAGSIGAIDLRGTVNDAYFAAAFLPERARFSGIQVFTIDDDRFLYLATA
jgi:hypothetical protein